MLTQGMFSFLCTHTSWPIHICLICSLYDPVESSERRDVDKLLCFDETDCQFASLSSEHYD